MYLYIFKIIDKNNISNIFNIFNILLIFCIFINMFLNINKNIFAQSEYDISYLPSADNSARVTFGINSIEDISISNEIYNNIWGENFQTELRLLPDFGEAELVPKSGHWYPSHKGGLNSTNVLVKYDNAFHGGKSLASGWELVNRTSQVQWHGHCNGYAASALRHREPKKSVQVGDVIFTPKDIKALLTGIYMGVRYKFLGGERCENDPKDALPAPQRKACDDVNPGLFHVVLTNWIGLRKQAIIFDRNADHQVWNFPLYGYETRRQFVNQAQAMNYLGWSNKVYKPNENAKMLVFVSTTVYYADAVNESEVLDYTHQAADNYEYILELDENGKIIGGEWAAKSQTEHPDFLWVPLKTLPTGIERQSANPHLDIDTVLQLWADSRGLNSVSDEPSPYDILDTESNWGQFKFYDVTMGSLKSGSEFSFLPSVLNITFKDFVRIGSSTDALKIVLDGKNFATPYLFGRNIAVHLPINEPGITKFELHWNFIDLALKDRTNKLGIYTME